MYIPYRNLISSLQQKFLGSGNCKATLYTHVQGCNKVITRLRMTFTHGVYNLAGICDNIDSCAMTAHKVKLHFTNKGYKNKT